MPRPSQTVQLDTNCATGRVTVLAVLHEGIPGVASVLYAVPVPPKFNEADVSMQLSEAYSRSICGK